VKWGLLSRNPADAIDLPYCQRPEWHTLSEDDIRTLLEAAQKTPYFALFYLAIFTEWWRHILVAADTGTYHPGDGKTLSALFQLSSGCTASQVLADG